MGQVQRANTNHAVTQQNWNTDQDIWTRRIFLLAFYSNCPGRRYGTVKASTTQRRQSKWVICANNGQGPSTTHAHSPTCSTHGAKLKSSASFMIRTLQHRTRNADEKLRLSARYSVAALSKSVTRHILSVVPVAFQLRAVYVPAGCTFAFFGFLSLLVFTSVHEQEHDVHLYFASRKR